MQVIVVLKDITRRNVRFAIPTMKKILAILLIAIALPTLASTNIVSNLNVVGIFPTIPTSNIVYRGFLTMTQSDKTNIVVQLYITHAGTNIWSLKPCSSPYLITGTNLPFWGKPAEIADDELLRKLSNPTE